MALPDLIIYVGMDNELLLTGPGVASLDLGSYDEVRFSIDGTSLSKTTASAAEAEVQNGGANLLVHEKTTDQTGLTAPVDHEYQLHIRSGASWQALTEKGIAMYRVKA